MPLQTNTMEINRRVTNLRVLYQGGLSCRRSHRCRTKVSQTLSQMQSVSLLPSRSLFSPVRVLGTCSTLLNTGNVNEHEKKIYCVGCYRRQFGPHGGSFDQSRGEEEGSVLVGRGLGQTSVGSSLETPPISPNASINEANGPTDLSNSDADHSKRSSSLCSSQSGASSSDDSRPSNSSLNGITYIGGVTTSRTSFNVPRPAAVSSANGGGSFKLSTIGGNVCPRCSKSVYSAEEVKAAGKVISPVTPAASIFGLSTRFSVLSSPLLHLCSL